MVEGLVPPRKQHCTTIRFDTNSAVAIELNFVNPLRAVGQLRDRGAVHRFDEVRFSIGKRCECSDSGLLLHSGSRTASNHFISHTSLSLNCTPFGIVPPATDRGMDGVAAFFKPVLFIAPQ